MENNFEILVEKEEIWANMLMQFLRNNNITCTALPVYGAGFVMRSGTKERLKVYVPAENIVQARALMEEFFLSKTN